MSSWNSYLILEVLSTEDGKRFLVGRVFGKTLCRTLKTELVFDVSNDDTNATKHPHDIMLTAIVIIMFNMMSKNIGLVQYIDAFESKVLCSSLMRWEKDFLMCRFRLKLWFLFTEP